MNRAQLGVFEHPDKIGFGRFMQTQNRVELVPQVSFEVLRNFFHETSDWFLWDEQFCGLLIAEDLAESNGSRAVAMRLLDSAGGRGGLAGSLGGELLARCLSSGALAGCLLGSSHVVACE